MQKNTRHIVLIIGFLFLLTLPTIVQLFNLESKYLDNENRKKINFPTLNITKPQGFVRKFKSYYRDNFGMRNTLLNSYLNLKNNVLEESPLPSKVIIGKDDFLFLGNSFSNTVNESLGFDLFSLEELQKIAKNILARKKWLESQNIKFYIAVAPSKHSIYREKLPFRFPKIKNRKEQLLAYLKNTTDFEIIDLGKQFEKQKINNRLYRRNDSHWNDIGAFYASQTLLNRIKLDFDIKSISFSDYKIDSIEKMGGNSKMINYKKDFQYILKPTFFTNYQIDSIPKYYKNETISESRYKNNTQKFKILLFRDSFSSALIPFLNESFNHTTYIWSHKFDEKLIKKEKPDIVVIEYTERYLERCLTQL